MVKILNGEIVQDDDPRLQQTSQQQPQARQRPVGRIRHDTSATQGRDGEEGGGLLGTGFDLSAYLGNNSEPVFTSPPVTLPGGREIPAVDFTLERLFILAVCYGTPPPHPKPAPLRPLSRRSPGARAVAALAGPRGLLAVCFIWVLTQLSAGQGTAINEAAGVAPTPAPAGTAGGASGGGAVRQAGSPRPRAGAAMGRGQRLGAGAGGGRSRLLQQQPQD